MFSPWPKLSRLNRDIVITEKIDGTNAAIQIVAEYDPAGELLPLVTRVYAQSRTRMITPENDNQGFARWVRQNERVLIETLGEGIHFGEWWGCGVQRGYDLSERRFSLFNTAKWGEGDGAASLAAAREKGVAIYSVPVLYSGPWTGLFGYKGGPESSMPGEWLDMAVQKDWPGTVNVEARAKLDELLTTEFPDDPTHLEFLRKELTALVDPNPRPRYAPSFILEWLARVGSVAAPGFNRIPMDLTGLSEEVIRIKKDRAGIRQDETLYKKDSGPEGICIFHKASGIIFKATIENDEKAKSASS